MSIWTGNEALDKLRNRAALSPTGIISVSIEELNSILPASLRECAKREVGELRASRDPDLMRAADELESAALL